MKVVIALFLCLLVPTASFASDNGYKVVYDGGSLPDLKAGTGVKLYVSQDSIRIAHDKTDLIAIQPASITRYRTVRMCIAGLVPRSVSRCSPLAWER
jgi:hypothetical protein